MQSYLLRHSCVRWSNGNASGEKSACRRRPRPPLLLPTSLSSSLSDLRAPFGRQAFRALRTADLAAHASERSSSRSHLFSDNRIGVTLRLLRNRIHDADSGLRFVLAFSATLLLA